MMEDEKPRQRTWRTVFKTSLSRNPNKSVKNASTGAADKIEGAQSQSRRLGKDELGPHANEEKMPKWLVKVLQKGDQLVPKLVLQPDGSKKPSMFRVVETPQLIPALSRLSWTDFNVANAWYCNPSTHHVGKLRREGSFCGYRNIQMLLSYVLNTKTPGHESLDQQPLPTIFTLQEMIEDAWIKGFNTSSRDELGSLQMTRKFIGTSEAEALFLSLGVPVTTKAFVTRNEERAYDSLVNYMVSYFGVIKNADQRVYITDKPPILLQRRGHSMTVIGVEQDIGGSNILLVFDPHFRPRAIIKYMALSTGLSREPAKLLKPYRYGPSKLAMYDAFEIVEIAKKDEHIELPAASQCGTTQAD